MVGQRRGGLGSAESDDRACRRACRRVRAIGSLAIMAILGGCPDAPPEAGGLVGTGGRGRYIVTLDLPAPDLAEYRTIVRDKPADVEAYVKQKRQETANAQANLDVVVKSLGGHIVARWWMTGQATIEVSPASVPSLRQAPGVKDIVPDAPLR